MKNKRKPHLTIHASRRQAEEQEKGKTSFLKGASRIL